MDDILSLLTDKDEKAAFENTKRIAAASERSAEYYPCLGSFASLLDSEKSYVRTRAFLLICAQAKWDGAGRIAELLPSMMPLLNDPKPTVVRQCLPAVKELLTFRPELRESIAAFLPGIDLSRYKDTVRPLIEKDLADIVRILQIQGE